MKKNLLAFFLFIFIAVSTAQNRFSFVDHNFDLDSLKGFNETRAKQDALYGHFFGSEYKVFMYRAKRNFINNKYHVNLTQETFDNYKTNSTTAASICVNGDFEASPVGPVTTVSGWNLYEGFNTNSCLMTGCCPNPATANKAWIQSTPCNYPGLFTIPNSPLGGNKVIQLNDSVPGFDVVRLQQTFTVSTANSTFDYAYFVIMNGTGHACCDQPYFRVELFDCTNNLVTSSVYSLTAPGPACALPTPPNWFMSTSGLSYHTSWQLGSINLNAYTGSCVTVKVTMSDCDGGAHAGYCFFDATCSAGASNINVNGIPTVPTGTINVCGQWANLQVAPTSTPALWNGPAASGIISNTNASITTSVSGTYTLTTGTGTNMVTSSFSLNLIPNPVVSVVPSSTMACTSSTPVILSGTPSGGFYSGTNVSGNLFIPPGTPGVYPINYMYISPTTSCYATASASITVAVCTGIQSLSKNSSGLRAYPNPNSGDFTISSTKEETLTITNELGQVVRTVQLNSGNSFSISVTNLATGIYFIKGNNFRDKIVVTK